MFINSPIGITIISAIVAWLLSKLFTAKPEWQKYQGTIIAAIKWAEKVVPDNSPDTNVQRLNAALQ
jgi:hypothetical protein